jgi:hypothetical protein
VILCQKLGFMRHWILVFGALPCGQSIQMCTWPTLAGAIATAAAQARAETTVEQSIKALPNRDTQIGVYLKVFQD